MFETILVPTDGSDHANKAVELASDIAEKYKAHMIVLHVLPTGPIPDSLRRMAEAEHIAKAPTGSGAPLSPEGRYPASTAFGQAEESDEVRMFMAEKILADAKRVAKEKGVETISGVIEDGDPTHLILDYAKKEGANLIVMGSRGLGNLKGLLMGSVSHKVSQMSPCSCITVK